MISVQHVSPLGNDCNFAIALLIDGKPQTYRLAIESISVDGNTIERIVCEDSLTQLLHTHPATAQTFFRLIGNIYHGKKMKFLVDLDASDG
jgi:hypothetical protein